jgi:hypothetical protein
VTGRAHSTCMFEHVLLGHSEDNCNWYESLAWPAGVTTGRCASAPTSTLYTAQLRPIWSRVLSASVHNGSTLRP